MYSSITKKLAYSCVFIQLPIFASMGKRRRTRCYPSELKTMKSAIRDAHHVLRLAMDAVTSVWISNQESGVKTNLKETLYGVGFHQTQGVQKGPVLSIMCHNTYRICRKCPPCCCIKNMQCINYLHILHIQHILHIPAIYIFCIF
jgi:hypothetical protein